LDDLNSSCPRCGGGFHCGVNDAGPCGCTGLVLSDELRAWLRERYSGCLCWACLRQLAETGTAGEPGWSRRCFLDPAEPGGWPARLLDLLLTQDGSATRLCERISGGTVQLVVHAQRLTTEVPAAVQAHLPGERFVERCVSLVRPGEPPEVMMDNLSYIALADLPHDVAEDLLAGHAPIGHLLERVWLKRRELPAEPALQQRLWRQVGVADAGATRSYRIDTPEGPAMLITECFRRGMRG
jgi:chorismate-pyruvate lyase